MWDWGGLRFGLEGEYSSGAGFEVPMGLMYADEKLLGYNKKLQQDWAVNPKGIQETK